MFKLYLKTTLLVFLVFISLMLTRLMTFNIKNPVNELLASQQDCDTVCLFLISPGRTTVGQAKTYLKNHDWIVDVRESAPGTGYAQVSWDWSGTQPDVIDASRLGKLTFVWDDDDPEQTTINESIVETISIYTHAGIYLFERHYGTALNGSVNDQLEGILGYAVYYNRSGSNIALHIDIPCPVSLAKYWSASVRLTLSIGQTKGQYVPPVDMIKMC